MLLFRNFFFLVFGLGTMISVAEVASAQPEQTLEYRDVLNSRGSGWSVPPESYPKLCHRFATVFGVMVCVTTGAWSDDVKKVDHVANVFYQLLDNDADGFPDDPAIIEEMVSYGYILFVPADEDEGRAAFEDSDDIDALLPDGGEIQMTGAFEAVPGSCNVPSNRGASDTDRSTWAIFADTNSGGSSKCDPERDATVEEILHLITMAALYVYPDLWLDGFELSVAGAAIEETNGDCGWGYSDDWIDPSSGRCSGQYAYDDETCTEDCVVVEGIYWAIISYIGGLYTYEQAESVSNEWLMATPDASMKVLPEFVDNAMSLEEGSPALYALVSDQTSEGHRWLPSIMPNGKYTAFGKGPSLPVKSSLPDSSLPVKSSLPDSSLPVTPSPSTATAMAPATRTTLAATAMWLFVLCLS